MPCRYPLGTYIPLSSSPSSWASVISLRGVLGCASDAGRVSTVVAWSSPDFSRPHSRCRSVRGRSISPGCPGTRRLTKELPPPFAVAHFGEARPWWGRAGNSKDVIRRRDSRRLALERPPRFRSLGVPLDLFRDQEELKPTPQAPGCPRTPSRRLANDRSNHSAFLGVYEVGTTVYVVDRERLNGDDCTR